jgi:hypothetical protein
MSKKSAAKSVTTITLSSKNYSSWSLRGWLLLKLSGLKFEEVLISPDDPEARAEILLLSPSILVPCLTHERRASALPFDLRRDAFRVRDLARVAADEPESTFPEI